MPEALSQDEVDALLNLVQSMNDGEGGTAVAQSTVDPGFGTIPGLPSGAPASGFEQYNALPTHQINVYDFKRPERVSKSQVIALEALHEVFARNVSASLSGYLRTILEVRLISVEQFTYSEFTMSLPIPTSFNLLSCEPLEGNIILEVNPSILYPIIDRLLGGGKSEALYLERPFTNIELALVNTILSRIIGQLRETWESVKEIDFRLYETESNPFLLQIVAPNEPIVLLSFEALMGDYSGMINVCIPFKVIEPIMPEFSQSNWFSSSKSRHETHGREQILSNIFNSTMEISAILAETPLSLKDILALRPGDIIDTGVASRLPVVLSIQGRKKYRGVPGMHNGKKVVRITGEVSPADPDAE
ncbi:MAG: flagellar motor switch protein FliM [Planctomycetes bacterium]|nr:flagellar motor switch protein FliM [Planctomycetota bacterium]